MKILVLDPFHGGSHARFVQALRDGIDAEWTTRTLPARHWKWRMRGSAAWFATRHADTLTAEHDVLLTTSMLPLAELVGLAPMLATIPRVLYFHENQLAYPVRDEYTGERDHHYGFTQLMAALAATRCVFNSAHNRDSFLTAATELLRRMPDAVDATWLTDIAGRSTVLGVPLDLPEPTQFDDGGDRHAGPILLWNHRWEHDKNPDGFLAALRSVRQGGARFRLIVCGQRFRAAPDAFDAIRAEFADQIIYWGYTEDRAEYYALLGRAHIAVSTAHHEFFGLSMLEATHFGARPLVPNRLSYPELFPAVYRYEDDALATQLIGLCRAWESGRVRLREDRRAITAPHREPCLDRWRSLLTGLAG